MLGNRCLCACTCQSPTATMRSHASPACCSVQLYTARGLSCADLAVSAHSSTAGLLADTSHMLQPAHYKAHMICRCCKGKRHCRLFTPACGCCAC